MSDEQDPILGQTISGYEVISLLGEGGIGRVYLARHPIIGKQIAIKALKPHYAKNATSMARFFQEAKAVNEIHHENVVDIFNLLYDPDKSEAFILMEFLEGCTLADFLKTNGPPLLAQLGHIGLQLCSALAAAHFRGIFHRDLKPENIFLIQRPGQKNFVKIIDFGLAKLGEQRYMPLTRTGSLLGTPAYMAPEQLMGESADARSDIYALGLILYEMATGTPALEVRSVREIFERRLKEDPPDPRAKSPGLSTGLSSLILRCLARERQRRYASAVDIVDELAQICSLDPELYLRMSRTVLPAAKPSRTKSEEEYDNFYETEDPATKTSSGFDRESELERTALFEKEDGATQTIEDTFPTIPEINLIKKEPES